MTRIPSNQPNNKPEPAGPQIDMGPAAIAASSMLAIMILLRKLISDMRESGMQNALISMNMALTISDIARQAAESESDQLKAQAYQMVVQAVTGFIQFAGQALAMMKYAKDANKDLSTKAKDLETSIKEIKSNQAGAMRQSSAPQAQDHSKTIADLRSRMRTGQVTNLTDNEKAAVFSDKAFQKEVLEHFEKNKNSITIEMQNNVREYSEKARMVTTLFEAVGKGIEALLQFQAAAASLDKGQRQALKDFLDRVQSQIGDLAAKQKESVGEYNQLFKEFIQGMRSLDQLNQFR